MIKSKICHRVILFEIKQVESHEINQITAISSNRKNRTITVFVTQGPVF